jgi:uncharacterized protein YndB with AHSA1/START domain
MDDNMGVITRTGVERTLRFERAVAGTPEQVWTALTQSDGVHSWLAEPISFDARVDGAVHLRWSETQHVEGQVLVCDPPHVIAFSWFEAGSVSTVRFELLPEGIGACLLVLEHGPLTTEAAIEHAASWHLHLDVLERALRGEHTSYQDATGDWVSMRARYAEAAHTG